MDIDNKQESPIAESLLPIDQDTVSFYGHDLVAVILPDGRIAAVLRWLCDSLSLNLQSQLRVIRGRTALADGLVSVQLDTDGGPQPMFALTLDVLAGWLFAVDERRVKEEARADVVLFQRECVRALSAYFESKRRNLPALVAPAAPLSLISADPQIAQIVAEVAEIKSQIENLTGVTNLLREHQAALLALLALPGQVAELGGELSDPIWQALGALEDIAVRQNTLDQRQEDAKSQIARIDERTQRLTPAHAQNVREQVNRMVQETQHLPQPLTWYIIYGRLKQRFRASSYREIADEQYAAVLSYLQDELRRGLAGEGPEQGNLF